MCVVGYSLPVATFLILVSINAALCEMRWCKISNLSSSPAGDGWVQFDDSRHICFTCSDISTALIAIKKAEDYECCRGVLVGYGSCKLDAGSNCATAVKCDGVKQCGDGSDELGCGGCPDDSFACPAPENLLRNYSMDLCISRSKVCDSRKDCPTGTDETGCLWHRGRCEGFRCGGRDVRCIPSSQVCDGTKHCVDGSDESNCLYCSNQLRCEIYHYKQNPVNTRTAHCVGTFRICDGRKDCSTGIDEKNCYRWREWSSWSECRPPTICTKTRRRSCISGHTSLEVDPSLCYDDDDGGDFPSVAQQTERCPPCIPATPPTSSHLLLQHVFNEVRGRIPVAVQGLIAIDEPSGSNKTTTTTLLDVHPRTTSYTSPYPTPTTSPSALPSSFGSDVDHPFSPSIQSATSIQSAPPTTLLPTTPPPTIPPPTAPPNRTMFSANETRFTSLPSTATSIKDRIISSVHPGRQNRAKPLTGGRSNVGVVHAGDQATRMSSLSSTKSPPPTTFASSNSSSPTPDIFPFSITSDRGALVPTPESNNFPDPTTPRPSSSDFNILKNDVTKPDVTHTSSDLPSSYSDPLSPTVTTAPTTKPGGQNQSTSMRTEPSSTTTSLPTTMNPTVESTYSFLPVILVIVGSAGVASLILIVVCITGCCCSERRHKRGKWKPSRRSATERGAAFSPIQLDLDHVEEVESQPDHAATLPFTSFARTAPPSGADSGIDDVNLSLSRGSRKSSLTNGSVSN